MTDYTAAEAAQVIGVSERRVRQLVDDGTLTAEHDDEGRLRVDREPVHRERERRRRRPAERTTSRPATSGLSAEDVRSLVESIIGAALPRMIESAAAADRAAREVLERTAAAAQAQVAEEHAGRLAAEARAAALQARLDELAGRDDSAAVSGRRGLLDRLRGGRRP